MTISERELILCKHGYREGPVPESIRRTLPSGQVELPTLAGANDPNWKVAPTPEVLQKRRVEITGPANDAKMVINMLNSGADACMIDLEDAMAPSGKNVVEGHFNIYKAARGELVYEQPLGDGKFKRYQIGQTPSTLMVRVRGLHMKEVHATAAHVGPVPATLFDIGVHLANNGKYLQDHGLGPFLYIPKLHSGVEAEVLEKVLAYCEKQLQLTENGTKVTTLIETLPAIFQTEEIAYALKNRIVGQNCGVWCRVVSVHSLFPLQVAGTGSQAVTTICLDRRKPFTPIVSIWAWSSPSTRPTANAFARRQRRGDSMPWGACQPSSQFQVPSVLASAFCPFFHLARYAFDKQLNFTNKFENL